VFQVGEAVMWVDGQLTSMGSFEGRLRTYANAISENGLVVGSADDTFNSPLPSAAWLYDGNTMIDLGYINYDSVNDRPYSMYTYDVNSSGQVVGYSAGPSFSRKAFIYSDGELYAIDDLLGDEFAGWQIRDAYSINDEGWISGTAFAPGSSTIVGYALQIELGAGCNGADLAEPYGQHDFFDVSAFLNAFSSQDAAADLAEPFGAFDFFDVSAFLNAYSAGCP
jgi:probable HAF family extracellular repeat protein